MGFQNPFGGPVDDSGEQMKPFYEMESSSPSLALKPGKSATHIQTIIHLYGEEVDRQQVPSSVAPGIELAKVKTVPKQGKCRRGFLLRWAE